MTSFGPIAPFYDLLMGQVPYESWAGYYRLLLAQQDIYPIRLLDVACGTGRIAELLTEEGFDVTGVDISEAMIQEARRKSELRLRPIPYHVADAAEMDLGDNFEGAYSFFDSFNYITQLDRLWMAFDRTAKHIEPGGSFIFDLNTAFAFEEKMFDQQDRRKKAVVQYDWKGEYDPDQRIIRVEMDFWHQGDLHHEVHVQRAHSMEEVREGLLRAGFKEIQFFDSYTLDPPRGKSDRIHVAARRVGASES